jgi:hypothetical protein
MNAILIFWRGFTLWGQERELITYCLDFPLWWTHIPYLKLSIFDLKD